MYGKFHPEILTGSPERGRQTTEGWGKWAVFELNTSVSRKQQETRPKLLLMTNRKLHIICFQLASRSMTLICYTFEFFWNFAGFRTFGSQQWLNEWIYSVSQKNPPPWGVLTFFIFFTNGWELLINFLHTYYAFLSTLDYKFLFSYPRFWRSYAILSVTTHNMLKMSTIGQNACVDTFA